jgi:predicted RNase H-like HicB family nuclease
MSKKPFPYRIIVGWSDEDECYVAELPAMPYCVACGDTEAAALKEVKIAATAVLDARARTGREVPASDLDNDLVTKLSQLSEILNLSSLARKAAIRLPTLQSKLRRKTQFTVEEEKSIREVLAKYRVAVTPL